MHRAHPTLSASEYMGAWQVLALEAVGVPTLALTSLTSKEDLNAAYKRLDTDLDIRLVYGEPGQHKPTDNVFCLCAGVSGVPKSLCKMVSTSGY